MKIFLFALFVAAAVAAPLEDDNGEPVELIVNGVAHGQPLEISDVLDIKVKEHVNGQIAAVSSLLHPYSAQGIAEAAAAEEAAEVEAGTPVLVVDDSQIPVDVISVLPEVNPQPNPPVDVISVLPNEDFNPQPVVIPEPAQPEVIVPEPVIVVEAPAIVPEPVQVVETPAEPIPVPVAQIPNGEIFNDGNVQVTVNTPQQSGLLATLQSWFNMAINYISNGAQTTQQIV